MCTIVHFSDVHLPFPPGAFRTGRILHPKRLAALLNFVFRRSRKYIHGEQKLTAFATFLQENPVDYLLYTGDTVNLGLEAEFLAAAPKLRTVLLQAKGGALTTPGNHDLYLKDSLPPFATYMDKLDAGDTPVQTAGGFPRVKWMGDEAVAISLNSAKPNPLIWKSSGRFPQEELDALKALLERRDIAGRKYIFVMTHFAVGDADGLHGLENAADFLDIVKDKPNITILHGHNHHTYSQRLPGVQPPVYCSGSLTKENDEGFLHYELTAAGLNVRRGIWKNARYTLTAFEG